VYLFGKKKTCFEEIQRKNRTDDHLVSIVCGFPIIVGRILGSCPNKWFVGFINVNLTRNLIRRERCGKN
jgi:hypothetical protein